VLATVVRTKPAHLAAMLLITIGYMIQEVVVDALSAKMAPAGGEATMFAIMASLMNLALSARQLFTRYLNKAFAVSQYEYSNLDRLMVTVGAENLGPAPPAVTP
jgi:BT1 family